MIKINCVIKNNKNQYIRLNENGCAVTCSEQYKSLFEESKAKNVLSSLPKTLRKFGFKVVMIPDIPPKEPPALDVPEKKTVIQNDHYVVPDQVSRWIDKFGVCEDVLCEAKDRKDELYAALSNVDKAISNYIHKVEFREKIDMYQAWLERKELHILTNKRRMIKDEILILETILRTNFQNFKGENIRKAVDGLATRKFTLRIVEESEDITPES